MPDIRRKTTEMKKDELIEGLVAARQKVQEAIRRVPPERLDEIFLGSWSIKDLLAHLVGWDATNLEVVQKILAGEVITLFQHYDKDWHSYNARLVAQYKVEPFEALLDSLVTSHRQLIDSLKAQEAGFIVRGKGRSPSGRGITLQNLLRMEARDEVRHAEQVREWLATE